MKKEYIAPNANVYNLKMESFLLDSSINNLRGGSPGTGTEENPVNFSRGGRNDWDDEDEEEDY